MKQNTVNSSKRISYWDIAKGIAIMLMILGHTELPALFRAVIFSFHMPFFVIANGYFIKSYDIKRTFCRSVRTLLVPYMITCVISAMIYTITYTGEQGAFLAFMYKIKAMAGGMSKISTRFQSFDSVWVIWFVCSLFITRNLYVIILSIFHEKPVVCACIIGILAYTGYWIGENYAFMPWSLDVALVSLIFIGVGDWMHRSGYLDKNLIYTLVLPFFCWAGMMFFFRSYIELAMRSYPAGIFSVIEAIAGSIVLISASKYMERFEWINKTFSWLGKNSMVILGIHCMEMMYFKWSDWIFPYLPWEINWIGVFIIKSIFIIALTAILTLNAFPS